METIETFSPEETYMLGKKIGEAACPNTVYALNGDLGVGKTVFTQGLAAGLGIDEPVTSPTFTILQNYDGGRLPFFHFDVYRIGDIEEMDEIGYEDCFFGDVDGLFSEPLFVYLEEGRHELSFTSERAQLAIESFTLRAPEKLPTYSEYAASVGAPLASRRFSRCRRATAWLTEPTDMPALCAI